MTFCPSCGKVVMANESFCWSCGAPLPARAQSTQMSGTGYQTATGRQARPKNAMLAIVLSFVFPGLGQYYVGQKKKGRAFIVIGIVLVLSVFVGIGVILYPLFWLFNMIDAFLTIRRVDAGLPPG